MTLDEAVAILNRENHRGHDHWDALGEYAYGPTNPILAAHDACEVLTEFEAIAVAREYERIARERPDPVLCRPLD